ncbi:MAG: hypothetical protein AMXMBFR47_32310 [Planctomycetota bacterium]
MKTRTIAYLLLKYVLIGTALNYAVATVLACCQLTIWSGLSRATGAVRIFTNGDSILPVSISRWDLAGGSILAASVIPATWGPAFEDELQIDNSTMKCRRLGPTDEADGDWEPYEPGTDAAVPSWSSLRSQWPRSAVERDWSVSLTETLMGWPFSCFYGNFETPATLPTNVVSQHGCFTVHRAGGALHEPFQIVAIPLVPHALPFIANVTIYALVAFVGRNAIPLLLRVDRRRRGLCATCGYDVRGTTERCPECGNVLRSIMKIDWK